MLVIIISVILTIMGGAYIYVTETERILAMRMVRSRIAFYLADAGVERARAWIISYSSTTIEKSYGVEQFTPEDMAGPQTIDGCPPGSYYEVAIDPDDGNVGKLDRTYIVYSTGTCPGMYIGGTLCVSTKTIRQEVSVKHFAKYAYFSYEEVAGGSGGKSADDRQYFTNFDYFDGPVHSNDQISIFGVNSVDPQVFSKDAGLFYEVTTSSDLYFYAGDSGLFYGDGYTGEGTEPIFTNPPPTDPPDYPPVEPIHMFSHWNMDRLYNVADWKYSVVNPTVTIFSSTMTVTTSGGVTDKMSIPVGGSVLYVNGDITSISSGGGVELQRWLTVVAVGTITIKGDIHCSTTTPEGMLGLVAGGNIIIQYPDDPLTNNPEIDAFLLAYRSFFAEKWSAPRIGTTTINGGIIQHTRMPWGTRPADYDATERPEGYHMRCTFDSRAIDNPPPYFPRYIIVKPVTWEQLN